MNKQQIRAFIDRVLDETLAKYPTSSALTHQNWKTFAKFLKDALDDEPEAQE